MKRKYFLVVLVLVLSVFFLFNVLSVNANMYKILDSEGNIIRITNNPVLSIKEIEAGCKILSAPEGIIMPTQDQITNGQEIKQEISSGNEKYDFRKTNWGMSKEQVKATEDKKPDIESEGMLVYEETISGKNFGYIYFFSEDKLHTISGSISTGEHTNKNLYIDDYEELKETLTKKYGKPTLDKVTWKNDLYKNDEQDWGTAISIGHLVYVASWETSTTKINLVLAGDNFEIKLTIVYYSRELKGWAERIKEKEASKDF